MRDISKIASMNKALPEISKEPLQQIFGRRLKNPNGRGPLKWMN